MLKRIGMVAVRWPKTILIAFLALLGIGIVLSGSVSDRLGVGGFTAPATESAQADAFVDQNFGTTPNLVLQVVPRNNHTVANPNVIAAASRLQRLAESQGPAKVIASFTQESGVDLRSRDWHSGLILVHVEGTDDDAAKVASRIMKSMPTDDPYVTVRAGGSIGVLREIENRVNHDLIVSESIAVPAALAALVVVFGGVVAALLPLAVGITSIVTTLLVLLAMTFGIDVSIHAKTVATAFGLGLSIDFGLLMVSRFREERASGLDHQSAVVATVSTAGRTIFFSAATVAIAMVGLLVFPVYFLRSIGLTASVVVILSALSAILLLPAILALLGNRIDALSVIRRKKPLSADSEFWRRSATAVTRRPAWALPVIAILLAMGIPFASVQLALPDERALPVGSNARLLTESLHTDYAVDASQAITLLARTDPSALSGLATEVSLMDGVVRVDGPIGRYEHGKLVAGPGRAQAPTYAFAYLSVNAQSAAAQQLVRDIRAKIHDRQVEVGGPTATLIDSGAAIAHRLPLAISLMALATFVLLFLFTGSVVVPIKALVLNVLVLSGVLGAMVWVFQDGHFASILGITPAPLNLSMVVLLCCIAFSLSVDYEIFLLSRIKEARDSGLSNNDAIVVGLGRVGRIISSAAILLTITLVSFANGLSFMKMFGIGTALAIVIDATVIRGVVVPAFLRLAGELNWWAPRPLKRLHARFGFSEAAPAAHVPPATPQQEAGTERIPASSPPEVETVGHRRPIRPPGPMSAATIPLRLPNREAKTERLRTSPPTEADTVRYRRLARPPGGATHYRDR